MGEFELPTIGFQKYVSNVPYNRGVLHFPGVYSDDPRYIEFLKELANRLEEEAPPSETEHGLLKEPFIPGGWLKLHNLSGYKMNPMGVPRVGIKPKSEAFINSKHRRVYEYILWWWFDRKPWVPTALRINKFSSTGPPHWSYDPSLKLNYLMAFNKFASRIQELSSKRRWIELFEDKGVAMMSAITRRFQPTDWVKYQGGKLRSKPRTVMTFEGHETTADKSTPFPDMFTHRTRLAVAFSNSTSGFQQAIFNGYRANALPTPCWKHTTPLQIATRLNEYPYVVAGDVEQFDQNMPHYMTNMFMEKLGNDWSAGVVEMAKASLGCPFVVNEDRINGTGRFKWIGDPRNNDDYYQSYGFPSGIPCVSDVGKVIGVFIDLVPCLDLGQVKEDEVESVLLGTHPKVLILNAGDDFLVGFKNEKDRQKYISYMEDDAHPYFKISLESPASFLGNLICTESGVVTAQPNILSFPLNTLSRERGIDSRFSPFWAYGYRMKKRHYALATSFPLVDQIMQRTAKDKLGQTIDEIVPQEMAPQGMDVRSYFDQMFIENPDRIHYKINPNQVSAELLESIFISVDAGTVARILQSWRK